MSLSLKVSDSLARFVSSLPPFFWERLVAFWTIFWRLLARIQHHPWHLYPWRLWIRATLIHSVSSALIILTAWVFLTPGLVTLPPMDRDEPRFAQASKQMMETGHYGTIYFQQEPRLKKPIGIYWLQVVSVKIAQLWGVERPEQQIWVYRLPSLISAFLASLLIYWLALAFVTPIIACLSSLLFIILPLVGVEARLATTDSTLLASILLSIGALAYFYRDYCILKAKPKASAVLDVLPIEGSDGSATGVSEKRSEWELREPNLSYKTGDSFFSSSQRHAILAVVFWIGLGLGVLLKGPMILYFVGLLISSLTLKERSFLWIAPLYHIPSMILFAVFILPWIVYIIFIFGADFFHESIGKDLLLKLQSGQESHGAPPGTYIFAFLLTAWPLSSFMPIIIYFFWTQRQKTISHPLLVFLLAWVGPAWFFLELVPTKLPHYVLPLYPALTILFAYILTYMTPSFVLMHRLLRLLLWFLPLIPLLLFVILVILFLLWGILPPFLMLVSLSSTVVFSIAALYVLTKQHRLLAAGAVFMAAYTLQASFYTYFLKSPAADMFKISSYLAEYTTLVPRDICPQIRLVSSGYREPSLVFLTQTDIDFMSPESAAHLLATQECSMGFIADRNYNAFRLALGDSSKVKKIGAVEGIKINGGDKIIVYIYGSH